MPCLREGPVCGTPCDMLSLSFYVFHAKQSFSYFELFPLGVLTPRQSVSAPKESTGHHLWMKVMLVTLMRPTWRPCSESRQSSHRQRMLKERPMCTQCASRRVWITGDGATWGWFSQPSTVSTCDVSTEAASSAFIPDIQSLQATEITVQYLTWGRLWLRWHTSSFRRWQSLLECTLGSEACRRPHIQIRETEGRVVCASALGLCW